MTTFHSINPDLSKPTCRVCLQNKQSEKMSSIFDLDGTSNDLHIYEKIEQCADIKVLLHEEMPNLICDNCHGLLQVSYKFRKICQHSNDYLKELLFAGEANLKIEKPEPESNPLSLPKNTFKEEKCEEEEEEETCSKYKVKLRGRQTISEEDIPPNSPRSEDFNGDEFDDDDDDEVWFDIDYNDDEDDISWNELDIKKKTVNSLKTKKVSTANNKKSRSARTKTLDMSSDGTAIIQEKKDRTKKVKKEKQPHICDVCGNIYQRRYALEVHMKRHSDTKPYECEICGYAFYSNFELIRHMRTHTGSRPYKCSYCPRAFGDQSTLIKHERIHRNERPFKCETCGKSFTYSNVLKYHILTHTGEKPYSCEICGKCFNSPHHLRAHLKTLQHQNDPRTTMLLQNIRKNNTDETLQLNSLTLKI